MPEIMFIMGKSATGKDHVAKALLSDPELKLKPVLLYTTRPMRSGEREGVEYHFTDDTGLEGFEAADKVIEKRTYQTVAGPWNYFTADDGQIQLGGENYYLVIGTLEAYLSYVKYFGREHLYPIYIEVSDKERLLRSIKREEKNEHPKFNEVCRRYLADEEDFSENHLMEAGICERFNNDGDIADTVEAVKAAIVRECRPMLK